MKTKKRFLCTLQILWSLFFSGMFCLAETAFGPLSHRVPKPIVKINSNVNLDMVLDRLFSKANRGVQLSFKVSKLPLGLGLIQFSFVNLLALGRFASAVVVICSSTQSYEKFN